MRLPVLLAAPVVCWMLGQAAVAETFPYCAKVTAATAPVFSGPSEDYYATDTLVAGDEVEIYQHDDNGWYAVRPPAGSYSWVFGAHVDRLENNLGRVNKRDVAVRIGSRLGDSRSSVQVRLDKDEMVEILGEEVAQGQQWYKIAPPNGEFRWVRGEDVGVAPSASSGPAGDAEGEGNWSAASPPRGLSEEQIAAAEPIDADEFAPAPLDLGEVDYEQVARQTPRSVRSGWVAAAPRDRRASVEQTAVTEAVETSRNQRSERSPAEGPSPAPLFDAAAADSPPSAATDPASDTATPVTPITTEPAAPPVAQQETDPERTTAGSDDLAQQLEILDLRLSHTITGAPDSWQLELLEVEAEQLLARAGTVEEREATKRVLHKIDRFLSIQRRYRRGEAAPSTSAVAQQVEPLPAARATPPAMDYSRYDATGILRPVVSRRPNAPRYALVEETGRIVSFVTPAPDVNLQPYLGRRVGVVGNRDYLAEWQRNHVTAGRVTPISGRIVR